MKILIVYYSRTNITKKVALELRERLGCDIEEIIDLKDRSGMIGYIGAGRDVMRKKVADIKDTKFNPFDYDLVLVGTPCWVGTMSLATMAYFKKYKGSFKKIGVFVTQGSERRQKIFDEIEKISGLKNEFGLQLSTKEIINDKYKDKLDEFILKINSCKK